MIFLGGKKEYGARFLNAMEGTRPQATDHYTTEHPKKRCASVRIIILQLWR